MDDDRPLTRRYMLILDVADPSDPIWTLRSVEEKLDQLLMIDEEEGTSFQEKDVPNTLTEKCNETLDQQRQEKIEREKHEQSSEDADREAREQLHKACESFAKTISLWIDLGIYAITTIPKPIKHAAHSMSKIIPMPGRKKKREDSE